MTKKIPLSICDFHTKRGMWDTLSFSKPEVSRCLGFVFCYCTRLLEWLLNLSEKVVLRKDFGLITLSQGHQVEEATDDKSVQPGETKIVEEPVVLGIDYVSIADACTLVIVYVWDWIIWMTIVCMVYLEFRLDLL